MTQPTYTIHTDGGSRGNPGPAASGYIIEGHDIQPVHQGVFLGVQTNNVAEYTAVILALQHLKSLLGADRSSEAHIDVKSDSELVVRQMQGIYKVKDAALKELFLNVQSSQRAFHSVTFHHVRREHNVEADRMVNEALDQQESSVE